MKNIKVAIDSGPLTGGHAVRGVGVYTREIIRAFKESAKDEKDIEIVPLDFSTQNLKLKTQKFDLVHYPYFHPFFITLPLLKKSKTIVTIHDLIPLIYPKHYPPGLRGRIKFLAQKILVKNVDGIIAVSETSKKDIVRFLGVPQEKITVVYEAPREIFRELPLNATVLHRTIAKYQLPKRFVLYVGDVNYNKNILGLAKACKIARTPLVIVGKQAADENVDLSHPENRPFAEFLKKYGKDTKVMRLGFVPDKDLVAIYNLAAVYCQPSFYEGFGLSVLEAFVCGTPVIISRTQALVEVTNGAALVVDSKNSKDMAEKMTKVIKNSKIRESLFKKGKKRVKNFSWRKTADETILVYKKILEK